MGVTNPPPTPPIHHIFTRPQSHTQSHQSLSTPPSLPGPLTRERHHTYETSVSFSLSGIQNVNNRTTIHNPTHILHPQLFHWMPGYSPTNTQQPSIHTHTQTIKYPNNLPLEALNNTPLNTQYRYSHTTTFTQNLFEWMFQYIQNIHITSTLGYRYRSSPDDTCRNVGAMSRARRAVSLVSGC